MASIQQAANRHKLAIACPKCGKEFQQTLGRFRVQRNFTCPGCGTPITVSTRDLDQQLRAADRKLSEFTQKLGKTIKIKL